MRLAKKLLAKLNACPVFYRKVWLECAKIPRGQVRTYGWLAKKIGNPKAARAVGQALARNPFAPVVPCHRVIAASGKLGGFSAPGGLRAKRILLRREGFLRPTRGGASARSAEV